MVVCDALCNTLLYRPEVLDSTAHYQTGMKRHRWDITRKVRVCCLVDQLGTVQHTNIQDGNDIDERQQEKPRLEKVCKLSMLRPIIS